MKRTFREPCGCTYRVQNDREEWSELCDKHRTETTQIHDRWAHEHHQRVVTGTGNASQRRELDALCRGLRETA